MLNRNHKVGYYFLEGSSAFATAYYFYYLFFFMNLRFGFGNAGNLAIAALSGFVYVFASWFGGKFAQRYGYFVSLRIGFTLMASTLILGSQIGTITGHCVVLAFWTVGMCFTWPALEALVSENEPPNRLPRMVGMYNVSWAGCSALSYFIGGALLKHLGLESLFWLPACVHLIQLIVVQRLEPRSIAALAALKAAPANDPTEPQHSPEIGRVRARAFMRMAWVANPFAYVAINTVVAVIPELAKKLELSIMFAGFFCSIWFFTRLATFVALWLWTGWHYRFRWLLGAYGLIVASFLVLLLVPVLWIVIVAQVVFGLAVGLIYYSSLYYSMDVGETKGEHGGIHEAAIGTGLFAGPAIGATALRFFPEHADSSVWAVCGMLVIGAAVMLIVRNLSLAKNAKKHNQRGQ